MTTRCNSCGRDFDGDRCPQCHRSVAEFPDLFSPLGIGFDEHLNPTIGIAPGVSTDLDGGGLNVLGISVDTLGSLAGGAASVAGDVISGAAGVAGGVLSGTADVAGDVLGGVAEVAGDILGEL